MPDNRPLNRKTHVATERPPFERIALLLQGGGALGAYQGGVYQTLTEANLHPDWVAGISIGAINWETVSTPPPGGNPADRARDVRRGAAAGARSDRRSHYVTDLTFGLGEVVFDYLKDS
jgi:predicted acylesterase/phospholipase RssA